MEQSDIAGARCRIFRFTHCGTASIQPWPTPVYRRKFANNLPATHLQKRTRFTRITRLNRCGRLLLRFHQ